MMPIDDRNGNGNRDRRRPWLQRYPVVSGVILTALVSVSGLAVGTWHKACNADEMAHANEAELKNHDSIVHRVPAIDDRLSEHVEDFKDFRTEQRAVNLKIDRKLDRIISNGGS